MRPDAVRRILAQGPAAIDWLLGLGVPFTRDEDGRSLHLTREGGHGARRIAHAADATGRAVHAALLRQCRARPNIRLIEHAAALDLLLAEPADAGTPRRCLGARVRVDDGDITPWLASHTVLATGGLGQVYAQTTNPDAATGDGVTMAWRAGCQVADMEFVQFHPTALQVDGRAAGLVTERCAAKAPYCACRAASASCPRTTRARNWRRATSWRARSGPRCRVSICPTCTWTSRTGRAPGWTGTFPP